MIFTENAGKAHWPSLLALAWLASYAGVWCQFLRAPWAADASESAGSLVEVALGQYIFSLVAE